MNQTPKKGNEKPTKPDCNWFSVYLIVFAGSTLSSFCFKSIFSKKIQTGIRVKFHDYFHIFHNLFFTLDGQAEQCMKVEEVKLSSSNTLVTE